MTGSPTTSVLGILSWMKEHQSEGYMALEEIATTFHVNRDSMLRNLQWLQRYECVKHGGSGNAAWSITDHGRVRLVEGRFTKSGAFLSSFGRTETFPESNRDQAGQSTVLALPLTTSIT